MIMAHANQERWSRLVDIKLRNTLVTRDNLIFNTRYEGDPKAGKVKIPVRDTEVAVKAYDKAKGLDPEAGTTTYLDLLIDQDEAVNELIDGFDAASVPDGITAERLDSAGYALGLSIDKKSIDALEGASGATVSATKTAATETNAYKLVLEAKRVLSRKGVPSDGRFLIVAPEFLEVLMLDEHYIKQGDLSQELVQSGVVGRIAGFNVFESNNMDFESTTRVTTKKTTTEFIAGHPNWCHRVMEWQVPVHLQSLAGSGNYIGASAVQGRKIYGIKVSKPQTLYIKRVEAAS
nr:MAG TPA: Major capsid protein [Caudoviricetes sp.]